jgi:hypothetical protein
VTGFQAVCSIADPSEAERSRRRSIADAPEKEYINSDSLIKEDRICCKGVDGTRKRCLDGPMGRNSRLRKHPKTARGSVARGLIGGAAFLIGIILLATGLGSVVYIAFNSAFSHWHTPIVLSLSGTALMVVTVVLLSEPAKPLL